ncbi:nonribosomal peptide [Colletotrichum plurivorum]|uniref:Nonribosomal peptide n=1 Tax=Colletotrichum plurivorum TaxID=2175906 RepID=A0A8H6KLD8_9PEZI|nr:nonribosomal peptide [Colletotrichum plurivorum]
MTPYFAQTSLSEGDVRAVVSFCRSHKITQENFYTAAWCYTLGVYSAASAISTKLLRVGEGHVLIGSLSVSGEFEAQASVLGAISGLKFDDTPSPNNAETSTSICTGSPGALDGGSAIQYGCDQTFDGACTGAIPAQTCLLVSDQGRVALRYLPESLPSPSPELFLETFTTTVRQFATSPHDTPLCELEILGPLNRDKLHSWSPSSLPPIERCIHDYVDEHARQNPRKEAVVATEGPNFTYAELSALSSKLARHLTETGIKKGDIVPILFEKSSLAVLAIVAILKAGAAYVGLSAETPVNFLRECASIANVPLIITSRQRQPLVNEIGYKSLVIDQNLLETLEASDSSQELSHTTQPSDLAYLVFTSGSTGVPKAVMIEHRAYVTDAVAQQKAALLTSDARVLHFASYNFDATNFDVLSTLIAGGTICVPTEFDRINRLAGAINDLRANFLGVTATLAQILDPTDVPLLKVVILCGEANSPDIVDKWTKHGRAGLDVANGYGPSEASCAFSYNVYTRQSPQANNVGRALEGACWGWVVNPDNHGQLLPVGAKGELFIQGPTLSRGYLNEPEKTAKAFIENPGWLPAGTDSELSRLYKTGDLVRQLADQSYEVFGRIDTQVKLNGQRIELGEIGHRVSQVIGNDHTIAVEAIETSSQEQGRSKILVAFYAPKVGSRQQHTSVLELIDRNESASINVPEMKTELAKYLKPIAIPKAFIPLKFIPVTIQGKLDRKFLQTLAGNDSGATLAMFSEATALTGYEAVRGGFEKTTQDLFARSLNLAAEAIFRDSDFFALGGDSLKAIKLVSLARKLGLSLSVPDILQKPRLAHLAEFLEKSETTHETTTEYKSFDSIDNTTLAEIRVKASEYGHGVDQIHDVIQATDLQASCVAFSTHKEERRGINWLLCDFETPQNEETLRHMCEVLTKRHGTLRTFFVAHRRHLYQVVSKSFQPPIRTHLHVDDISKTTQSLMEDDLHHRDVDMSQPQTAFELLSTGDASMIERLVIRISAAQYDGHSVAILGREMTSLLSKQQLRSLEGSYPAYLHHARTVEFKQGLEYWRTLLEGAEMPQIAARRSSAGHVRLGLDFVDGVLVRMVETKLLNPGFTSTKAISMSYSGRSTRATIVKAAWALTLAELTGRDDVVFGSTGWGRNHSAEFAQEVMGSCTSHIPTRARLNRHKDGGTSRCTYGEVVEQLQDQHVASMRFESIGANTIVEKCTPWKRWTRFSSLLIFQGLDIETPKEGEGGFEATPAVKFTEIMDPGDRADVIIHVEPFGEKTRVMMAYTKKNVPDEAAGIMLRAFERHLQMITQAPDQPVNIGDRNLPPLLPVTVGSVGKEEAKQHCTGAMDTRAEAVVQDAWIDVLDVATDEFDTLKQRDESFINLWGNLVSASALAYKYRGKGFDMSTEDVLRCQTVRRQVEMLQSCA